MLREAIGSVFEDYDQYENVEEPYMVEMFDEKGKSITVTETRAITRLKRVFDDRKRSYYMDYAAVTSPVLQKAIELDQSVTVLEKD